MNILFPSKYHGQAIYIVTDGESDELGTLCVSGFRDGGYPYYNVEGEELDVRDSRTVAPIGISVDNPPKQHPTTLEVGGVYPLKIGGHVIITGVRSDSDFRSYPYYGVRVVGNREPMANIYGASEVDWDKIEDVFNANCECLPLPV